MPENMTKRKKERFESDLPVIEQHLERMELPRLARALSDPRQKGKCFWTFEYLLEVLLGGMLKGATNLRDVETFSEVYDERVPDSTLSDLLVQIDPSPIEKLIARGVKEARRSHELDKKILPLTMVAIDGKHLSTSKFSIGEMSQEQHRAGGAEYHNRALRAMDVSSDLKLMLGQHEIEGKTSEAPELGSFIAKLEALYGKGFTELVSVDAGITSLKNATLLHEKGYFYKMAVKGNQKGLFPILEGRLGARLTPDVTVIEKVGGKRYERELFRGPLAEGIHTWSHATEVWRIRQRVTTIATNEISVEDRYYITNIPPHRTTHTTVLAAVRLHWAIENNGNWIIDTVWTEDDSPWMNRALSFVTLLRLFAYNIISRFVTRRLRSAKHRRITWASLLQLVEHALMRLRLQRILNAPIEVTRTLA